MISTRRQLLQRLGAGLSLALLSGCGLDTSAEQGRGQEELEPEDRERLEELTLFLTEALPLDELTPRLLTWAGDRSVITALAPLGARALAQSSEEAPEWEAQIRERFIEPLEGATGDEFIEALSELCLTDYDLLRIIEIGGWWLSDREMLSCVLAYLIDWLDGAEV